MAIDNAMFVRKVRTPMHQYLKKMIFDEIGNIAIYFLFQTKDLPFH